MAQGTLKTPFGEKGFSFIDPDPDENLREDVFLHVSNLRSGEDWKQYTPGTRVAFDVIYVTKDGVERPQAANTRMLTAPESAGGGERTHSGTVKFWSAAGFGFVVDDASGDEFYVHWSAAPGRYLRGGDCVEFALSATISDKAPAATNVKVTAWNPTGDAYSDVLDMGPPRWAATLAGDAEGTLVHAEDEPWNYQEVPSRDRWVILRSYIKYTFLRLQEGDGHVVVTEDEGHLAFNTGLVTRFQEEIFAVFSARPQTEPGPPWKLRSFEKASDASLLALCGSHLPPLASYFDDPSQLVYDTSLALTVNVEHVPHDADRFPTALKDLSPEDLAALITAKAPEAVDRVKRNYKTAIPQYYRDGNTGVGKMQLLLPIGLLRRDKVELALAVDRLASGVYLGRTVLTLDWAYNNARLLTRPDTDWLRP